jgi:CBS domain-containing protein
MQPWQVRDVMTRRVVTATTDVPVGQLARLLAIHRISAVPIVDDDRRVVGVVSEADLLPTVSTGRAGTTAADVMNTRPPTVPADAPLSVAALKMEHRHVERLLVTSSGCWSPGRTVACSVSCPAPTSSTR